jgi:holin-like protein
MAREVAMVTALAGLIGCQLMGEVAREALHLPIPGPVIGMFLLAAVLVVVNRKRSPERMAVPPALGQAAAALIGHMGLLFVPAGVGIIAEGGLLRQQWLPIIAALIGSTLLGLAVTGLVMFHVTRRNEQRESAGEHQATHAAIPGLSRKEAQS